MACQIMIVPQVSIFECGNASSDRDYSKLNILTHNQRTSNTLEVHDVIYVEVANLFRIERYLFSSQSLKLTILDSILPSRSLQRRSLQTCPSSFP